MLNTLPNLCNPHSYAADKYTLFNLFAESATSYVSDFYWFSTFFDIITGCKKEVIGLSSYGMAFGIIFSLFSTGGAAYSHCKLNIYHQTTTKNTSINATSTHEPNENTNESDDDIENQNANLRQPLLRHTQDIPTTDLSTSSLTYFQKIALFGAWIAHIGDIVGPIVFVVDLATNNSTPRWGKAILHCSATIFGGFGAIANVRTCRDAMISLNREI